MADDTSIGGVNDSPEWALEKALRDLLKGVETSTDSQNSLESALKENGKITKDMVRTIQQTTKEHVKVGKKTTDGINRLGDESSGAADSLDEFDTGVRKSTSLLGKSFAGGVSMAATTMGILISQTKEAINSTIEAVDAVRQMHNTGLAVEGSFVGFARSIAEAGVTAEQAMEMTDKFAMSLGHKGVPELLKFSKSLYNLDQEMGIAGLTVAEMSEYAGNYLNRMRMAGVYERMNSQRQQQVMHEYLNNLTAYSKILNVSREDVEEGMKKVFEEPDWKAYMAGIQDPGERQALQERMNVATSQLMMQYGVEEGQRLAMILKESIARPSAYMSEGVQSLLKAGLPDLASAMVDTAESVKYGEGNFEALIAAIGPAAQRSSEFAHSLIANEEAVEIMGNVMAGTALNTSYALEKLSDMTGKSVGELQELQKSPEAFKAMLSQFIDPTAKAAAGASQQISETFAKLEFARMEAFLDILGVKGGDGAVGALEDLTSGFRAFEENIIDNIIAKDMGAWLTRFTGSLEGAINKINTLFGTNFGTEWLSGPLGRAAIVAATAVAVPMAVGMMGTVMAVKGMSGILGGAAGGLGAAAGGLGRAALGTGKFLLRRSPWIMGAMGAYEGFQGYQADPDAGFLEKVSNAGSSALSGATFGLIGTSAEEIREGATPSEPVRPATGRVIRPTADENADEEPQASINTSTMDEVELLKSIASSSHETMQSINRLLRLNQLYLNNGAGMPA